MITRTNPVKKVKDTFDVSVVQPWLLTPTSSMEPGDDPEPKQKPELEPERLPKEDPGIQPNTTPKKDDDDDRDDDDDYEPYTEPEVGDDPDEITRRTTIM